MTGKGEIARTAPQYVVIPLDRRMIRVPWEYCRFGLNDVGHGSRVAFDVIQNVNGQQIRNVRLAP